MYVQCLQCVHWQWDVISDVILVGRQSVSELASVGSPVYPHMSHLMCTPHQVSRGALTQAPVPRLAPDLSHLKWAVSLSISLQSTTYQTVARLTI